MDTTAGFHLKIGNYSGLKRAHLEHDDDKFNGNEDIDYSLSHLNTNHTYVDNLADFYYEKYEKPIEQVNEKHKKNRQYGRMFKDFNEYKEKQKKSGRRKNYNKDTKVTTPPKHDKDENRLMVLQYADKESTDKIIRKFMNMGFTKEEVLTSMGEGMDDFTEEFNSRHNNMKIVEKFTHLDEGYVHSHANLYSYGRDRYGKPYYDINQSLFETYGGTKHQYDKKTGYIKKDKATGEPKKFKKGIKDVWSDFRDETDRSIHAHVNEKLVELAKTKGKSYTPPKFIRKDSEDVGVSHEKHKQKKQVEEFKKGIEEMSREVGMLDVDGNYYMTDDDGNKVPINIKDMKVIDAIEVGNKAFEKYKRMHDADMEFMEEEYDEKLKAKEERNKELEQQAKNYKESAEMELKTAGSLRKEQQSYRDEIESLKIELSTTKEESERLKQSNNTLKQSNSHLENKNAQLRQENEQLSTRNRFLDDLSNIDNDKNIKHQDEAIVAYLRHDKYKNDSKGFSDLVHRSMNFVDKSAQRRYGSHMKGAPTARAKTKDSSRELEL